MNKQSLLLQLILAAGFCAGPAFGAPAPAKDPSAPQNVNDYLEAHAKCEDGTIDILGAKGAAQSAKFQALAFGEVLNSLKLYQACLSPLPGYEKSCSLLARSKGASAGCRELADYAAMLSAIFNNGGDARAACEQFSTASGREARAKKGGKRNEKKHARMCDFIIAALKRGSQNFCLEAKAAGLISDERLVDCKQRMIYAQGVPERCSLDPDKEEQVLCREKATLLSALRSKNFQACALSPWCRAVTGRRAESCSPYLVRADKAFCEQAAAVALPVIQAKAARDAKIQAMKAKQKPVFAKDAPMQNESPEVKKAMKRIEENKPPLPASPETETPAP